MNRGNRNNDANLLRELVKGQDKTIQKINQQKQAMEFLFYRVMDVFLTRDINKINEFCDSQFYLMKKSKLNLKLKCTSPKKTEEVCGECELHILCSELEKNLKEEE